MYHWHMKPMQTVCLLHVQSGDSVSENHVYRDRTGALHVETVQQHRRDPNAHHWVYQYTIEAEGRTALVPVGARRLNLQAPDWLQRSADMLRNMPAYTPKIDRCTGHYDRPPVVVVYGGIR